uniref:Uncharacterized protein n=1 Tax=Rhizophora mucronata TaxID=61149 RepID=A0A2P2NV02_RHIMU
MSLPQPSTFSVSIPIIPNSWFRYSAPRQGSTPFMMCSIVAVAITDGR